MSVVESFLRGGAPSTSVSTLPHALSTAYRAWCWVLVYPRRWHSDSHTRTLSAPIFHFLFGQPLTMTSVAPDGAQAGGLSTWQLVYVTVQAPVPSPSSGSEAIVRTIQAGWDALPKGLREEGGTKEGEGTPPSFGLVALLNGHTHTRLGLFDQERWEGVVRRVQKVVVGSPGRVDFAAAVLQDGRLSCCSVAAGDGDGGSAAPPMEGGPAWLPFMTEKGTFDPDACNAFVSLLDQAVGWLDTRSSLSKEARDASIPAQGNNRLLLELVASLNPVLYQTRFVEPASVEKVLLSKTDPTNFQRCQATPDPEDLAGIAKLKAQRDANRQALKQTKGEGISFSVSEMPTEPASITGSALGAVGTTVAEGDAKRAGSSVRPFQHVFLLQKFPNKETSESDYREVGPVNPQPISAEFHLYQDIGDVLYVMDEFNNSGLMDFNCDNYLPEEGEVLVQLGPVEGVPFDDIDSLLDFHDSILSGHDHCDKEPPKHRRVICEGSCSGLIFPRVIHRLPTDQTTKLNPIARSQVLVVEKSPTAAMLLAAAATVRFIANRVVDLHERCGWRVGVGESGYTVDGLPPLALPPALQDPLRRCGCCGRRREKLLRCGGCKMVWYCSKKHQTSEWKSGKHKVECALWQKNREDAVQAFQPQLPAARVEEVEHGVVRTAGWSCAVSTLEYLSLKVGSFIIGEGSNRSQTTTTLSLKPFYIHVIGVNAAWVKDFVQVLGARAGSFLAPLLVRKQCQLRLIVFTDSSVPDSSTSLHNSVFAVPLLGEAGSMAMEGATTAAVGGTANHLKDGAESQPVVLVGPTYVAGDVWHLEGEEVPVSVRRAAMLIRVCDCKYHSHSLVEGASSALPASSPHGAADGQTVGVICFGPSNGEGLSFFSGTLDVCARSKLGYVPVRFVESSLVGAYHTAQALLSRLEAREDKPGVCAQNILKAAVLNSNSRDNDGEGWGLFRLNKQSACLHPPFQSEYPGKTAGGDEEQLIFINSYYFDVPTF